MHRQAMILFPALLLGLLLSGQARSANPDFQDFFFDVCANPTGDLAARCAETEQGQGNLSGDSESSLNPSQVLSSTDAGLAVARDMSRRIRERNERARDEAPMDAGPEIRIGPFSLLLGGRWTREEQDRAVDEDAERGYELDTWAVELGFDYRLNDRVAMGAMLGWEESKLTFDGESPGVNFNPIAPTAGTIDRDGYSLTAFANIEATPRSYLSLSAGFVSSDYDVTRNAVFQESRRSVPQTNVLVRTRTNGNEYWGAASWGYSANLGAWTAGPYLGVIYTTSRTDGYQEEDLSVSGLAMTVADVKRSSLVGQAGVRLTGAWATRGAVFLPQLRVEYEHEFDQDPLNARASFLQDATGNVYRLQGDAPDRDYFNLGLGLMAVFPNGWLPYADFQWLAGYRGRDSYRITLGLRKELQ